MVLGHSLLLYVHTFAIDRILFIYTIRSVCLWTTFTRQLWQSAYKSTTRESFWILLRSRSPFWIMSLYCAFLRSGRLVSTTPPNLSILAVRRPAAMKRLSCRSR